MFGLSTTGFISRKAFTMIINDPVWILDDVMNAWLDAYANKSKLEAASE
jgi:hypothetical protein